LILGCYVSLKDLETFLIKNNFDPADILEANLEKITGKKLYLAFAGNIAYGTPECYICITQENQLTIDEMNELLNNKELINDCEELSRQMNGSNFSISCATRIS